MISIIVPVLNRPANVQPLVDSIRANTTVEHEIIFVCSPNDKAQQQAVVDAAAHPKDYVVASWPPGPGDFARKINLGYEQTSGEYIFMGADDIAFDPQWDYFAMRAMKGQIGVVATNDKANRQVMRGEFGTHCLISRAYINEAGGTADHEPGVVLYEGYDHNFVDRELCEVARSRRRYTFAGRAIVRHQHPLWKTAPWDRTYRKALAKFRDDQKLFAARSTLWATRNRDIVAR